MDVLPEKPRYEPGETARVQVRMPFSEATVLVTMEREGIIAASVFPLSGKDPVIRVPIRDYAPNVFVSVLAVRGRIGSIQPTAMVDLGKPAFKLGITEIQRGMARSRAEGRGHARSHGLSRARKGAREDRGQNRQRRRACRRAPKSRWPRSIRDCSNSAPTTRWKLLAAMMGERPYQIETSTAQMQVVGKRHYGLKAIPPGGGGGRQITRELFNTLLLWKAVVALDEHGEAEVEVPLNDSLTSFKIVAVASAGTGLFGTGYDRVSDRRRT